ncbi:hypothetical protein EYF80_017783 [Liparis tanakae]|uniref:Uncharacterized protein n=1 Tax=Liparis tanakae TaxID=230148 RepID=A0A4Z2I3E1_9TELE|nr:hypothetical protein EYF80_017783 [Liparis tanakae]
MEAASPTGQEGPDKTGEARQEHGQAAARYARKFCLFTSPQRLIFLPRENAPACFFSSSFSALVGVRGRCAPVRTSWRVSHLAPGLKLLRGNLHRQLVPRPVIPSGGESRGGRKERNTREKCNCTATKENAAPRLRSAGRRLDEVGYIYTGTLSRRRSPNRRSGVKKILAPRRTVSFVYFKNQSPASETLLRWLCACFGRR